MYGEICFNVSGFNFRIFFQRVTLLTCFVHGLQKQTIQDAPYEFNIRLNIDFIIIYFIRELISSTLLKLRDEQLYITLFIHVYTVYTI